MTCLARMSSLVLKSKCFTSNCNSILMFYEFIPIFYRIVQNNILETAPWPRTHRGKYSPPQYFPPSMCQFLLQFCSPVNGSNGSKICSRTARSSWTWCEHISLKKIRKYFSVQCFEAIPSQNSFDNLSAIIFDTNRFVRISVTRWSDCLFNIWPFKTIKIHPIA